MGVSLLWERRRIEIRYCLTVTIFQNLMRSKLRSGAPEMGGSLIQSALAADSSKATSLMLTKQLEAGYLPLVTRLYIK